MSLKQIWQAANPKGHLLTAISFLIPIVCAMNLLNISPFSQYVVRGVILLAAVIFDRYKQKAKRAA